MMHTSPADSAIERLKASKALPCNVELILEHDKKLSGERISEERRKKFVDRLRWWAETLNKDFRGASKEDLEQAYGKLKLVKFEVGNSKKKKDLKAGTINLYLLMLKQFYKHIEGDDEEFPKKVRQLKPMPYQPDLISEDGETSIRIYTPEEIESMIRIASTPREKCLIALSYDCGGRLGEIMALEMTHIKSEPPFYKIYLHGDKTWKKTGVGKRWATVYFAVPYINDYLKCHPFKLGDEGKPFWVNSGKFGGVKNAALSQSGFKTLFDRIKTKAKIRGKRFHDLRHTKCTHLLRMGMPEAKVKKFLGHSPNSKQLGRYAHLVSEDIDEELSRMYGLQYTRKKHDDIPIPMKCSVCGEVNNAGSELCSKCNNPISAKAITNAITRERYWKQKYEVKDKERDAQLAAMQKQLDGLRAPDPKLMEEILSSLDLDAIDKEDYEKYVSTAISFAQLLQGKGKTKLSEKEKKMLSQTKALKDTIAKLQEILEGD